MQKPTIGYIVEFDIAEGEDKAFEQIGAEVIDLVEKTEPGTLMYEWHVSEDRGTARLCEWFTGSEGAIAHLSGKALTQHLPKLLEISEITNIDVFGTPNEKLAQMLADFPVSGPFAHLNGFTR